MDELQMFSQRLREMRASRGITQREFAEQIGITPASLSAYESSQKNPSVGVAIRIARTFSVSMDWLCGLSDEKGSLDALDDREGACIRLLEAIGAAPTIFDVRGESLTLACDCRGSASISSIVFASQSMYFFIDALSKLADLYASGVLDSETYFTCVSSTAQKYGKLLSKEELSLPF